MPYQLTSILYLQLLMVGLKILDLYFLLNHSDVLIAINVLSYGGASLIYN